MYLHTDKYGLPLVETISLRPVRAKAPRTPQGTSLETRLSAPARIPDPDVLPRRDFPSGA